MEAVKVAVVALGKEVCLLDLGHLQLGGGSFCISGLVEGFEEVGRSWICALCGDGALGFENWGGIGVDAGTVDSNVGSGYFVCDPLEGASQHAELLSSGITEQFTLTKPAGEVQEQQQQPADLQEEAAFSVGEVASKQVEEIDFSRGILMSDSCSTQLHELSKLDWMEPRPPGWFHECLVELFHQVFHGE
jgi:hypothetical protein